MGGVAAQCISPLLFPMTTECFLWKATCRETCPCRLGRGQRKRAGGKHLAGALLHSEEGGWKRAARAVPRQPPILLGPSVRKIRSCRQDNFTLQSYFLDCVFYLKDYQGDRFSTSASEHEGASSLKQKDFLSLPASKKVRQEFRSRCSRLWMICANSYATLW